MRVLLITGIGLVLLGCGGAGWSTAWDDEPAAVEPSAAETAPAPPKRRVVRAKKTNGGKRVVKKRAPRGARVGPEQAQAATRDPQRGEAIYLEGLRARAAGDSTRAIALFEQAGGLGFTRGWKDAATTYVNLGQRDQAIAACEQYLREDGQGEYATTVGHLLAALKAQQGTN